MIFAKHLFKILHQPIKGRTFLNDKVKIETRCRENCRGQVFLFSDPPSLRERLANKVEV